MTARHSGGGASWMRSRWRGRFFRVSEFGPHFEPWAQADTLADLRADLADSREYRCMEVQRRVPREDRYEAAGVLVVDADEVVRHRRNQVSPALPLWNRP